MNLRSVDTVLLRQALITGRVEDEITGRPPAQPPSVALFEQAGPGRNGRTIPLAARVLPGGQFVLAGDPVSTLPTLPAGESLDLRLVTRAVGYREHHLDFSLDAEQLSSTEEVRTIGSSMVTLARRLVPLAELVVRMTPIPVHLAGSVVRADDPGVPIAGARVRVSGVEGVRLAGRLHYSHGTDPVAVQEETEGPEIVAHRDLAVGDDRLPHGTAGTFSAGDILRIRTDPGETEYVTIASDGDASFREPGLAFHHPRPTTTIHQVALADQAGEPAADRAMGRAQPHETTVIELTHVTGLSIGQVIRVGDGATREYQVVRDVAPFGPVDTSDRGAFTLYDVPIRTAIDITVEHDDFTTLETTVGLDFRQPVNEQVFTLTA